MTIERGDQYELEVCNISVVPMGPFSLLVDQVLNSVTVTPTLAQSCGNCHFFSFTIQCSDIPAGGANITLTDAALNVIYQGFVNIQ